MNNKVPVGVDTIQPNMIQQLNNTNPPITIICHNNLEGGPIDRIRGPYFEMNPRKTVVVNVTPQVNRLALWPSDKIADTASQESKRRLINS